MSTQNRHKAYEDKVLPELQQARALLTKLETRARDDMAQTEKDLVKDVKARCHDIDEKLQQMKTTSDANAEQVKADIDTRMTQVNSSLKQLASKLDKQAKAS